MPDQELASPRRVWWVVLLTLSVAIVVSSAQSDPVVTLTSLGLDKVAHFFVYLVHGMVATLAVRRGLARPLHPAWALLGSAGFGAADEVHQSFVPGRTPEVLDAFADLLGATVGVLLASWVDRGKSR